MATAKPTVSVSTEFCERVEYAYRLGGIYLAAATIRGYVYHHTGYNMAEADALYLAGIIATHVEQGTWGRENPVYSHAVTPS
jgi:hypothetical protein